MNLQTTLPSILCFTLFAAGQVAADQGAAPKLGDADFPKPSPSKRHDAKVAAVNSGDYDLVLIGDSITHSVGELGGKYQPTKKVWNKHFAPRKAINLGYNGYRTEQILWNLKNGELDFKRSPKVAMILIGTNNSDDRNFKKVHSAEEIFAGTKAIVDLIKERHPTTKILVLRIFPRGGDSEKGVSPPVFKSSQQCIDICNRAGELTKKLADNKQVFWLDVNEVFLRPDKTINTDLMWDLLHPSPAGAEAWAEAVAPTLDKLMGKNPPAPERVVLWPADKAPVGDGTFDTAKPVMTVYRPAKPNGASMVICPGGGYGGLVTGGEGSGIAKWLNQHGITGIVLEYRLPRGRQSVPLLDAHRAIRIVRSNAESWGCDPKRVGIIGFSAGGHLASTAATHFDPGIRDAEDPIERVSCRPDFAVLVYPVISMGRRDTADRSAICWAMHPPPRASTCSPTRSKSRRKLRRPTSPTPWMIGSWFQKTAKCSTQP